MDRNDPDPPKLLGVVLCGGKSTRMGSDKALIRTRDGTRFLDLAVDRLRQVCGDVCLSGRRDHRWQGCTIADPPAPRGPISGVVASLEHAASHGFHGCVFNPVDTPHLTAENMRALVAAFVDQPDRVVCAAAGPQATRVEPLIAVYPTSVAARFRHAVDRGQYGLQRILAELDCARVVLPPQSCRNLNTPADLTDVESRP
jgi:molybdopterin-guanine dinucleotide biosynthesis protein A